MLKLLDIPKGWFAQFMFKRALESSAKEMELQAYMQGKRTGKKFTRRFRPSNNINHYLTRLICFSLYSM